MVLCLLPELKKKFQMGVYAHLEKCNDFNSSKNTHSENSCLQKGLDDQPVMPFDYRPELRLTGCSITCRFLFRLPGMRFRFNFNF